MTRFSSPTTPMLSPRTLRARAERRLAWLRRTAAAGTLTLAMLHGAPEAVAQAPTPEGSEFQVNTETADDQDTPKVAMDDAGNFVVVWESRDQDGSSDGIFAQRYDAAGVAQGAEFQVNTETTSNQDDPSVAMDADGDFVIVWESFSSSGSADGNSDGIFAQRYDAAGVAQGAEFQVNTYTTSNQDDPSVAMDAEGNFVVAWESSGNQDGSNDGIFAQRYNAAGVAQGSEFQVNTETTSNQDDPSVAMDADGDFVIVWESFSSSGSADGNGDGIYAQRYNAAGVAQGSEFQVNTETSSSQDEPSVAMDADGDFVVAWESSGNQDGSSDGIFAQRYNAAGVAQGNEFQVNTYTTSNQNNPSVAMDDTGDFVVAWESSGQDGSFTGVFAQRYNAAGVAQGSEFQVNTETSRSQSLPDIAMDADGDFVVAWGSFSSSGSADGSDFGIFA